MANKSLPIPGNELERIISLADLDLEFTDLQENFKDLITLATKVTGAQISLINIIDSYTQWSIAAQGIDLQQTSREESVCQYTIMSDKPFEVKDFRLDERFQSKNFVKGPDGFRYYFGIPLQITQGINIGAMCVLDTEAKQLTPEKIELMEIIAQTVVKRLKSIHAIQLLTAKVHESNASKKKAAHDIRGPLAGIIGLTELMKEQNATGDMTDCMEYISMINKSGRSLLDLADEILSEGVQQRPLDETELNLSLLKDKLLQLYQPQAKSKKVNFKVDIDAGNEIVSFAKNKLMQIAGNLISNAIKFTHEGGSVTVRLGLMLTAEEKLLKITVSDNGVGIDSEACQHMLLGNAETTVGTMGEKGYGFGLRLVAHLVESLNGKITFSSVPDKGTNFEVILPQKI